MRYVMLALELASLIVTAAGCARVSAKNYDGVVAVAFGYAQEQSGPAPAPDTKKVKRSDCTVCKGTGLVVAPGQTFKTECVNCEPPASGFMRPAPATSCLCVNCACKVVAPTAPAAGKASSVLPPAKPPAAILPPARPTVKPTATKAVPSKAYTYSNSCANGQCSTSRTYFRRGRR